MWIFGYGSLMWRPGFDFEQREVAWLPGYARELWQGSPDHRGVPQAPGRVATLVEREGVSCAGLAFRIAPSNHERILRDLDEREQGGYERLQVDVRLESDAMVTALTFVGFPDNPHYLGPAPEGTMIETILTRSGPSGQNREYVLDLARTLRKFGLSDPAMERLATAVGAR